MTGYLRNKSRNLVDLSGDNWEFWSDDLGLWAQEPGNIQAPWRLSARSKDLTSLRSLPPDLMGLTGEAAGLGTADPAADATAQTSALPAIDAPVAPKGEAKSVAEKAATAAAATADDDDDDDLELAKALSLAPLRAQDEGGVAVGLLSPLHGDEAGPKGDNEGADAELEARVESTLALWEEQQGSPSGIDIASSMPSARPLLGRQTSAPAVVMLQEWGDSSEAGPTPMVVPGTAMTFSGGEREELTRQLLEVATARLLRCTAAAGEEAAEEKRRLGAEIASYEKELAKSDGSDFNDDPPPPSNNSLAHTISCPARLPAQQAPKSIESARRLLAAMGI